MALVGLAVVLLCVVGGLLALRALDDDEHTTAADAQRRLPKDAECTIRLTAAPAVLCVTSYDPTHITYLLSGFKPRTSYQAAAPDGTVARSRTNRFGTNLPARTDAARPARGPEGATLSATAPILANGAVVSGTAGNGAAVTFFVPSPATAAAHQSIGPREEVAPDHVSIRDDTHLQLGVSCNPYGPAVQVKETKRTVAVGVFREVGSGPQLDCSTLVLVPLESPLRDRTVVSDTDGALLRPVP